MPCRSSVRSSASAASTAIRTAIVGLVLALATQSVGAKETSRCALTAPKYQVKGSEVVFEITIDCSSRAVNAEPFPLGEQLLVGLTVYAGTDEKNSPSTRGGPKRVVVLDSKTDSYDLSAQVIRVEQGTKPIAVQFQTDQKAITGKQYYLFAVWAASERKPCTRNRYARSGCQRDGYVIGDNSGVYPIAAYPGIERKQFTDPNGDEYTSERWIVERFR